jgi:catechol 2,3-dioxygenase-like lactoylglutathione lyase family enzyme
MGTAERLARTILAMRPFVPAKNFEASKRFYADLGFRVVSLGNDLAEMQFGENAFVLQNAFAAAWAENFVMHVVVHSIELWWTHIESLDLGSRHNVARPQRTGAGEIGLDVIYVFDPSGVLWHFSEAPRSR